MLTAPNLPATPPVLLSPLRFTILLFLFPLTLPALSQTTSWTLDRAVAHAQQNNLQVRQGTIGLDLNDVDVDEAKAAFLPSLNGSASHGYNWGQTIDPFTCLLYTSPSPRDGLLSRMPSSA